MNSRHLEINQQRLSVGDLCRFAFQRSEVSELQIDEKCFAQVKASQHRLYELIEKRLPIYGVTTGFGDSCFRFVDPQNGEILQANLVSYLLCGTGDHMPVEASRAMFLIRLKSLSRGYSGVSRELLERMQLYLNNDWIPVVPREGSLGASGDLIPLAYLAQCLQGEGQVFQNGKAVNTRDVLKSAGVEPYRLKPKEGLALVNGTSAMAGMFAHCLVSARHLLELSTFASAWLCLSLGGRTEPFESLVNEKASQHSGQGLLARKILSVLNDESYKTRPIDQLKIEGSVTSELVQDRYSLRCAPQILGPISDTLDLLEKWLESEINSTSDNPLIGEDGSLGMGGNFYGGYLSHGMDYLKISLAHMADLLDRQLTLLIDEKSNRGLPPNLANWPGMQERERHLHHGLKGLHQAVSAITSEIMAKSIPNGIFSRSSESHNQDKVSLGMSAAVQCSLMIDQMFTIFSHSLTCLAQSLDLKQVQLQGASSRELYRSVRAAVPFVQHDQPLDYKIQTLRQVLRDQAYASGAKQGVL